MINFAGSGNRIVFAGVANVLGQIGGLFGSISLITLIVDYLAILVFRERRAFSRYKFVDASLKEEKTE